MASVMRSTPMGDNVALSCAFRGSSELRGVVATGPNKRTIGSVGDLPYGDGSLEKWAIVGLLQPGVGVDQGDYFRGIFAKRCIMEVRSYEESAFGRMVAIFMLFTQAPTVMENTDDACITVVMTALSQVYLLSNRGYGRVESDSGHDPCSLPKFPRIHSTTKLFYWSRQGVNASLTHQVLYPKPRIIRGITPLVLHPQSPRGNKFPPVIHP